MSSIGSVFLRLGVKSDANKQLSGIFKGIQGQMLKFGAAFGAFNFIKTGVKQASDFAENWSVVTQAVGKDVQDSFMDAFSKLKRTSKTEFSEIAAMITGTFKSKGISDSIIKQMGPELMQRLEDTAAKFNVSTERAVEAFGSMMAGMTKPMKTLTKDAVVPLVENLDIFTEKEYGKKFKELAPDEQTLARMKFFLQETKKVPGLVTNSATTIGTFKGRLDSFKKSINDSSQAIAKNFMPTLAKVLEILSTLIKLISENITLFTTLIGIWAGFKIASTFVKAIKGMIALYTALAAAKAAAQGGVFGLITAGTVVAGVGAIVGGLIGGLSFGGSGSVSGASTSAMTQNNKPTVIVKVNAISGKSQATSNGMNINSQTQYGRGGS